MANKQRFLFVYRPSDTAVNRILENGQILKEWDKNTTEHEILFELDESLYTNRGLEEWLTHHTHYVNQDMIVQETRPDQTAEWVQSNKDVQDRLTIHDLVYTGQDEVADVISSMSPGGDIRKYLTAHSVSRRFSIEFRHLGTRDVAITGMEDISMDSVQKFLDLGICDDNMYEGKHPQYPPAPRILEWSDRVDDEWGLDCGAIGSISFPREDRDIVAGFDGFIIHGADQEVKDWCDERWAGVDSWTNRDELGFPWMYPDEYNLQFTGNEYSFESIIRMWWD